MDGYPRTYFKVAPFCFETTVFDTDDLSITRGSSLTLLALPGLLKEHLTRTFHDFSFDWIQTSASELVFRVTGPDTGQEVTIEKVRGGTPDGIPASKWNKRLQEKANEIKKN